MTVWRLSSIPRKSAVKATAKSPLHTKAKTTMRFPQLGIGAYIAAGYCANILANLAEGKEVKYFPKFYLSPLLEEI